MNQFNHDPAAGECGALSEGGLSSPLTAPVNKIIPFSSVDGYGNRTAIFLQGCNQNCLYCHNPETIRMCIACGRCVDACPANALSLQEGRVVFQIDKCCSCDTCIRICPHDASPRIRNLTPKEIQDSGFGPYYIDHTTGIWPQAAGGIPFNACEFQSKGDPITDLFEDLAAEQKARTTYDNILRVIKDPEICDPIRFLREREIVHFQRFGEVLRSVQDRLDSRNFYALNPAFDNPASQPQT